MAKPVGPVDDELEPITGRYDWRAAFTQNPGQTDFDWPEEADEAAAQLLADQVEGWASVDL